MSSLQQAELPGGGRSHVPPIRDDHEVVAGFAPATHHNFMIVEVGHPSAKELINMHDLDTARLRQREVLRDAEQAAVRHRLLVARRWEKRAAHAARRARQASQALA